MAPDLQARAFPGYTGPIPPQFHGLRPLISDLIPIDQPWAQALAALALLFLVAAIAYRVTVSGVLRLFHWILARTPLAANETYTVNISRRLAWIVPAVIVQRGIALVGHLPVILVELIANLASAVIVFTFARAISSTFDLLNALYQRRDNANKLPIKGYLEVGKIIVYMAAAILMIAIMINQSPVLLLSGLGAMGAVLMLVFKDTILSFVASVQLTNNDMVRIGDWIAMPQQNADGFVIDMALHTVKVQNWDKTVTTVPTYKLISESFINWRAMFEAGGRRIQRSLMIDQSSTRFLEPDEIDRLKRFSLLRPYLEGKEAELEQWNRASPERIEQSVNARRITNIGTFRAYVDAYVRSHPGIHVDHPNMFFLVRQLAPTPTGLPLEIYCFTKNTAWAVYEGVQADIFDHLLAILPEFHLRLFQEPGGHDIRGIIPAPAPDQVRMLEDAGTDDRA